MALRLDLLPDFEEALVAFFVGGGDEVGVAGYAFDELAVHVLGLDDLEVVADLLVCVGEERVLEVELLGEFFLGFDGVAGDAEDDCAGGLDVGDGVAEGAGFDGAAGGVGAGVEEEDYGVGGVVGEGDGGVVLVGEGEVFYDVVGSYNFV